MRPMLVSSASSGLFGGTDVTWNVTIPSGLGKNGLIAVCATGKEEGGDENPEEINIVWIGNWGDYPTFTEVRTCNRGRTGGGLWALRGTSIPPAGTYTIHVNYKDSPKQADRKCGVSAIFRNVLDQSAEATNAGTFSGGGAGNSVTITPVSKNSLVIAVYSWRNGDAVTSHWGTTIVENAINPGAALFYSVVDVPALQTVAITSANPDENGIAIATYAPAKDKGGSFLYNFL